MASSNHLISDFSKSILFICISVFFLTISYLIYINPEYNFYENKKLQYEKTLQEAATRQKINEETEKQKKWSYDSFSDVGVNDEKYPIVVLRTGYKLIKIGDEKSLVGWKYEVINTSSKNKYITSIDFELEDADGFVIASGSGSSPVQEKSYGVVQGTIKVHNSDLKRLSSSGWSISLSPSWQSKEKKVKGKRYDRLKKIIKDAAPSWVEESANSEFLAIISPKWKEIRKVYVKEVKSKKPNK